MLSNQGTTCTCTRTILVMFFSVLEFDSKDRQKDWEKGSGKAKVNNVYSVRD